MRDVYAREKRLKYWIDRVYALKEPDRSDIVYYINFMQEQERSALRIIRCIQGVFAIRRLVDKPLRSLGKEDIKNILEGFMRKGYSSETEQTYKSILKHFYKVTYGNNEYYPEQVAWITNRVSKDRKREHNALSYDDFLTEEEIELLIDTADTIQRKAFIAVGYETGARPEELLNIRIKDILFDRLGAKIIVRGKTGERITRVVVYISLLKEWLNIHPYRNDNNSYIWLSEATNHKFKPIGLRAAEKMFAKIMKLASINKRSRLYILRHSRATHLANRMTEAQLCTYFGWRLGTKVVQKYIHLSGINIDNTLASIAGLEEHKEESKLKVVRCRRCKEILSPNSKFCIKCGLDTNEEYINNTESDKIKELEEKIERLNMLFNELVKRID